MKTYKISEKEFRVVRNIYPRYSISSERNSMVVYAARNVEIYKEFT